MTPGEGELEVCDYLLPFGTLGIYIAYSLCSLGGMFTGIRYPEEADWKSGDGGWMGEVKRVRLMHEKKPKSQKRGDASQERLE